MHGDRLVQVYLHFFTGGEFRLKEPFRVAGLTSQQRVGKIKGVGEADATMAVGPCLARE